MRQAQRLRALSLGVLRPGGRCRIAWAILSAPFHTAFVAVAASTGHAPLRLHRSATALRKRQRLSATGCVRAIPASCPRRVGCQTRTALCMASKPRYFRTGKRTVGNTYEVNVWRRDERGEWGNLCIHRGESMIAAIWAMFGSRRRYGCITLEWRPRGAQSES